MIYIHHLERPNDIALYLDDAFGKIAAQELPHIDADGVAVLKQRRAPDRRLPNHNWAVGVDYFQSADPFVVVAQDFQQHISARSGREEDIVFFKQTGVVRDKVFRFGSLQLKAATHRASAAAEIEQVHLAVVVKNDLVLE